MSTCFAGRKEYNGDISLCTGEDITAGSEQG